MATLWWIGLGGFMGSVLRYALGSWVERMRGGATLPIETLVINVTGCLAIGILAGLAESRGMFSGATRAFLFVGLLGGFTTFSAFGQETFQLLRAGQWPTAALSTALQVGLGVVAVWAGHSLARLAV